MKRTFIFSILITLLTIVSSCNFLSSSPQKIFVTIGLNGNKIPNSFERAFKEIRVRKKDGILVIPTTDGKTKNASAEEYVITFYSNSLSKDIEKIKALSPNEETLPIIEAGLEMFEYADEIYKTDYLRIAKMIDENKSDEEVDAEIEKLEMTKGIKLDNKYNATMDLLLPYAEENGVEYKTINPYASKIK